MTVFLTALSIMAVVFKMLHPLNRLDNVPVNQMCLEGNVISVSEDTGGLLSLLGENVKVSSRPTCMTVCTISYS